MLMWGPLKDAGKGGFSARRQAEKQQPVYRLILLCVPILTAASSETPPSLYSPLPPINPHLTFLAAVSCMGAFPEQKQICLVRRHFHSLDPRVFLSCLKAEQRSYSGRKNVLTLLFMFCYTHFASPLLCRACSFLLANTQCDRDERHF